MPERLLAIQQLAASFKLGVPCPLKAFQRMLGLMASASSVLQLGLLHMRPLRCWLKPRVPPDAPCQGEPGLCCSSGPLEETSVDGMGCALGHGLQKEGGLDRRLQLRLWGTMRRKTGLRPLVEEGRSPSHQLPENAWSMFGPSHLSARPEGTSCLSLLGQYDGGVQHKLPGWSFYSSRALNLRSLRATHVPGTLNLGVDMLSRNNVPSDEWTLHPQTTQEKWGIFSRSEVDLFSSEDNTHCQTNFSKDRDALAHNWPNLLLYAFPRSPWSHS